MGPSLFVRRLSLEGNILDESILEGKTSHRGDDGAVAGTFCLEDDPFLFLLGPRSLLAGAIPGISSQVESVDEHTIRFSMFSVIRISFPLPGQCYPMELGDAGN